MWQLLTHKILILRFIDQLVSNSLQLTAEQTRNTLQLVEEKTSQSFLADLESIRSLIQRYNIHLIVANQQASSQSWFETPLHEREKLRGLPYAEEARQIRGRLDRGESISGYEYNFLIHQRLMKDLEAWSRKHDLPFVDIIKLLDNERHHLVSYVHLDAYANRLIAEAFADEIRNYFDCGIPDSNAHNKEAVDQ